MSDERDRRPIPEHFLVGPVAAAAGVIDAILIHRNGRPVAVAVIFGCFMGAFVYYGLRYFRRRMATRKAPPEPTAEGYTPPAAGGWANPRKGQKAFGRLARAVRRPGTDSTNPLAGRGAPRGRGPDRPGPRDRRDRREPPAR